MFKRAQGGTSYKYDPGDEFRWGGGTRTKDKYLQGRQISTKANKKVFCSQIR